MEKLAFKPWERVISDIKLVPENGHVDGIQHHLDCGKAIVGRKYLL